MTITPRTRNNTIFSSSLVSPSLCSSLNSSDYTNLAAEIESSISVRDILNTRKGIFILTQCIRFDAQSKLCTTC